MGGTVFVSQAKRRFLVVVRVVASDVGYAVLYVLWPSNQRVVLQTNGQSGCVSRVVGGGKDGRCGKRFLGRLGSVSRVMRDRRRGRQVVNGVARVGDLACPLVQRRVTGIRYELTAGRPLFNEDGSVVRI